MIMTKKGDKVWRKLVDEDGCLPWCERDGWMIFTKSGVAVCAINEAGKRREASEADAAAVEAVRETIVEQRDAAAREWREVVGADPERFDMAAKDACVKGAWHYASAVEALEEATELTRASAERLIGSVFARCAAVTDEIEITTDAAESRAGVPVCIVGGVVVEDADGVRACMDELGWSRAVISAATGKSLAAIDQYLYGGRAVPAEVWNVLRDALP